MPPGYKEGWRIMGQRRQLFVDDFHLTEVMGLQRTLNQVEKHPSNPVIKPEESWEGDGMWAKNSTMYDPTEGVFKLWYNCGKRTGYATSSDGLHWERPELGLVEFGGSARNNILESRVFQVIHGGDYFGALSAEWTYNGLCWSDEKGQYLITSPDGLRWTEGRKLKLLAGDTLVCTKTTECLTGTEPQRLPGYPVTQGQPRYINVVRWCLPVGRFDGSTDLRPVRRVQVLYRSDDLVDWKQPMRILTPDDLDDEMAQGRIAAALSDGSLVEDCKEDRRCEFYTVLAFPYEDMYIGLLLILDASYELKRIGKSNQCGPAEIQLVASRDLVDWQRLGDRNAFIPRGGPGEFDWAATWYSSLPIIKDNELWFFYTGSCVPHTCRPETRDRRLDMVKSGELPAISSIGLATLRRDGFISLDAGNRTGHILTKPFAWPESNTVHLNSDARGGEVRVAVCQPDGTAYPGYELSEALTGDMPDAVVRWKGQQGAGGPRELHTHGTAEEAGTKPHPDFEAHQRLEPGKMARLKIVARNAKLYSYWF